MDAILNRFYTVSELFRDDERLIAIAVKEHCKVEETKCSIYKDLLQCRFKKWIDHIEEVSHLATDDWMNMKEFMLDNGHDQNFTRGDMFMIESICMDEDE